MKCGICGKEFKDDAFDIYADHVKQCAETHKKEHEAKLKTEEMKKINEELESLKSHISNVENWKQDFKQRHPDIYAANFEVVNKEELKVNTGKVSDTNKQSDIDVKSNITDKILTEDDFVNFAKMLFGI